MSIKKVQRSEVVVIQHQNKTPSGALTHSTTIKVGILVDEKDRVFTLLSDTFIPIAEKAEDTGTIYGKYVRELYKKIKKTVGKEFPEKDIKQVEELTSSILSIIQLTGRRVTSVYKGNTYQQVRSRGI